MRRFFVFLSLTLWSIASMAQVSNITVMQYNLLQYGNYQGYGGCNETANNTQRKDECIRTILDYVKPDLLTVCEFGATQALQSDFLRHNLNINGVNYWKTDNILNYANSSLINHIFYNSRKMELTKHVALRTNPRDSDVYELYLKTSSLLAGDTIKLVCIVTHPKAGPGADNESRRFATMQTIMNYVSDHYANENVMIMGDFNMYRASESGYQVLTKNYSNYEAIFVDPLWDEDGVGAWNNNSYFARFHTQSTRDFDTDCFSSGGLDDRFDMILVSDEISMCENKIQYIDQSYYAVGNDGLHFDQSINQNGNSAVPADVAQALFEASDHLPVSLKLRIQGNVSVEENMISDFRIYPNPTNAQLTVSAKGDYRIANLLGQTLMMGNLAGASQQIDISNLPNGLYFISVGGVTKKFVKQ